MDALGHTPKAPVIENKVDATCGAAGSYDEVVKCECGEVLSRNTVVIEPTGTHEWDEGVMTEYPTFTDTGLRIYTCINCPATKEEIIPVLENVTVKMDCTSKTLSLEGLVSINMYVTFEVNGLPLDMGYVLDNGGVLVWSETDLPADVENAIMGSQSYIAKMEGSSLYKGRTEFKAISEGIPAKEYGDSFYFRPYILVDGEYQYGEIFAYGVKTYAEGRFEKSESEELKNTLVALLNYGAAAQEYFGYKTDALANADLNTYLANGWITANMLELGDSEQVLTPLQEPTGDMTVNFVQSTNLGKISKTLELNGAIATNYYISVVDNSLFENAIAEKAYFWTEADYNALKTAGIALTKENASYNMDAELEFSTKYGYEYAAASDQIFAKNWSDTLYMALVITDANGVDHTSGVIAYSPIQYAANKLSNGKVENIDSVCEWMVAYSLRAATYLG